MASESRLLSQYKQPCVDLARRFVDKRYINFDANIPSDRCMVTNVSWTLGGTLTIVLDYHTFVEISDPYLKASKKRVEGGFSDEFDLSLEGQCRNLARLRRALGRLKYNDETELWTNQVIPIVKLVDDFFVKGRKPAAVLSLTP